MSRTTKKPMKPDTTKLTIRLPREQVEFLKAFAEANGLTATEVIARYLQHLAERRLDTLSPEVREFVGSIPADFDWEAERAAHLEEKYGR